MLSRSYYGFVELYGSFCEGPCKVFHRVLWVVIRVLYNDFVESYKGL